MSRKGRGSNSRRDGTPRRKNRKSLPLLKTQGARARHRVFKGIAGGRR